MKKLTMVAGAAILATSMSGCLMPSNHDMVGTLVTSHSGATIMPIDNTVQPIKSGSAKMTGIIGITEGDCSINAAMKAGGIKKVHHVDYRLKNILGLVGEYETTVWGE